MQRHCSVNYDASARRTSQWPALVAVVAVSVHIILLAWSAYKHTPVLSEVGQLPAGISHWTFGRFDLYRVNPPLVRMIAAIPVVALGPRMDWSSYSSDPTVRSETLVGIDFVSANGPETFWLYTLGRWACIPFSVIGAATCYVWARDLYGIYSAPVATVLWCFCPNVLGNGSLIMTDVPAAALGVTACYLLWCWLKVPTLPRATLAGIALGFAELTKLTLLLYYAIWPFIWIAYRSCSWRTITRRQWLCEGSMLLLQLVLAVFITNCGYGFEASFRRLGEYRFQSRMFSGNSAADKLATAGNRFAGTPMACLRVPFPTNYVLGIDTQKLDFERGMRSYLGGKWSERGWWYFYLYAAMIKIPLGTLALAATSAMACTYRSRASWRDELLIVVPALALLVLISSESGFTIHFRYALPILPFLFIWASGAVLAVHHYRRLAITAIVVLLAYSIGSSALCYPHSLSYFNEAVGGPEYGHEHLLSSNISWGQDLLFLKDWCDAHPDARPLYACVAGFVDPQLAGIDYRILPPNVGKALLVGEMPPGWYVIDVNYLHGSWISAALGAGQRSVVPGWRNDCSHFAQLRPIARIGYSLRIYHVAADVTNAD
jgi:hypothetical protein